VPACRYQQRCKVHFLRNALAHDAGKGQRRIVLAARHDQHSLRTGVVGTASAQWRPVADQPRGGKFPRLARLIDGIRSKICLERLNAEIKRRTT